MTARSEAAPRSVPKPARPPSRRTSRRRTAPSTPSDGRAAASADSRTGRPRVKRRTRMPHASTEDADSDSSGVSEGSVAASAAPRVGWISKTLSRPVMAKTLSTRSSVPTSRIEPPRVRVSLSRPTRTPRPDESRTAALDLLVQLLAHERRGVDVDLAAEVHHGLVAVVGSGDREIHLYPLLCPHVQNFCCATIRCE